MLSWYYAGIQIRYYRYSNGGWRAMSKHRLTIVLLGIIIAAGLSMLYTILLATTVNSLFLNGLAYGLIIYLVATTFGDWAKSVEK